MPTFEQYDAITKEKTTASILKAAAYAAMAEDKIVWWYESTRKNVRLAKKALLQARQEQALTDADFSELYPLAEAAVNTAGNGPALWHAVRQLKESLHNHCIKRFGPSVFF